MKGRVERNMSMKYVYDEKTGKLEVKEIEHRLLRKIFNRDTLLVVLIFFIIVFVWHAFVVIFNIPVFLIPSPFLIATSFQGKLETMVMTHMTITFTESMSGYILGNSVAFVLAVIISQTKTLERGLLPYIISLRSVPIVAVAPLLVIWFGFNIWPMIFTSAFISFFPMLLNGIVGMSMVDITTLELMRSLNATRSQVMRYVRLPYAMPNIFAALKLSIGLSIIGAVVAEWIGTDKGLGFLVLIANNYVDTVLLFRALVLLVAMGVSWFAVVTIIEARTLKWRKIRELT